MASIDSGPSKRNLTVLAVVVACFAVLWPKIFFPMLQSILFRVDEEEEDYPTLHKTNLQKMLHPQMREAMGEARPMEKVAREGNQIPLHPSLRYTAKPVSKEVGVANLVIPVYTIAIILFFIYSVLKAVFKNKEVFHPYYTTHEKKTHKCSELEDHSIKRKDITLERKAQRALEQYGKDKVLIALKTIILEMEDFKGSFDELNVKSDVTVDSHVTCF